MSKQMVDIDELAIAVMHGLQEYVRLATDGVKKAVKKNGYGNQKGNCNHCSEENRCVSKKLDSFPAGSSQQRSAYYRAFERPVSDCTSAGKGTHHAKRQAI